MSKVSGKARGELMSRLAEMVSDLSSSYYLAASACFLLTYLSDRCKRHYQTITSRSKVKALVSELSDSEATKKEETLRTSFQKLADKVHGEEAAAPSKLSDPQRQRLEPFKHMHLYAPLPTIDSQLPEMSATADLASLLQYPPRSDSPRAIPTNPSDAGYYQRKDPERFFLRRPSKT